MLIVLISLAIITAIVSFFVYKKLKLEAALNDYWWKIKYEDILFPENLKGNKSTISITLSESGLSDGGLVSHVSGRTSGSTKGVSVMNSLISAQNNLDGVLVGIYRGVKVAVKPLNVKKLHLGREMLCELKLVLILSYFKNS
jgi:hypothetical protein